MALTDQAIAQIRSLIQNGQLGPGSRLPPEQQLAAELGMSRGSMREAVKALEAARVLDVRRGDGTYVTSLAPALLLEGLGFAVDLLQDHSLLEVMETRRMLEPEATATAAMRIDAAGLRVLAQILEQMRDAVDDLGTLVQHDMAFHRTVVRATGNTTLCSLMDGLSRGTMRARVWRGLVEGGASARTLQEHQAIYDALVARDAVLARATALVHINTSEQWLRQVLGSQS